MTVVVTYNYRHACNSWLRACPWARWRGPLRGGQTRKRVCARKFGAPDGPKGWGAHTPSSPPYSACPYRLMPRSGPLGGNEVRAERCHLRAEGWARCSGLAIRPYVQPHRGSYVHRCRRPLFLALQLLCNAILHLQVRDSFHVLACAAHAVAEVAARLCQPRTVPGLLAYHPVLLVHLALAPVRGPVTLWQFPRLQHALATPVRSPGASAIALCCSCISRSAPAHSPP